MISLFFASGLGHRIHLREFFFFYFIKHIKIHKRFEMLTVFLQQWLWDSVNSFKNSLKKIKADLIKKHQSSQ